MDPWRSLASGIMAQQVCTLLKFARMSVHFVLFPTARGVNGGYGRGSSIEERMI